MKISYRKFFLACAAASSTMNAIIEKAGVSCTILSSIRQGRNVNAATVGKLAAALGVAAETLLSDEQRG